MIGLPRKMVYMCHFLSFVMFHLKVVLFEFEDPVGSAADHGELLFPQCLEGFMVSDKGEFVLSCKLTGLSYAPDYTKAFEISDGIILFRWFQFPSAILNGMFFSVISYLREDET